MHYISGRSFVGLLESLREKYEVYVPAKSNGQRYYKKFDAAAEDMVVGEVRAFEPLKGFFFRSRQRMSTGFEAAPPLPPKPACIVGVKACDLKGFKVQDHVFKNHDYGDPFYNDARDKNLIIAADCTCAIDTCFCLALGVTPYPQENFDLSVSAVDGGYLVDVGSEKGSQIVAEHPSLFEAAAPELVEQRDAQRTAVTKAVETNVAERGIPHQDQCAGAVERNAKSGIWADEAKACVECGACNTVCPTCHCFLLFDQKSPNELARLRMWDSCLIKDFARVAGGANPRPKLWMRLRNRFEKKFDFFPKVAGVYACTGCGRCVSACPAKIDIRNVLKRLVADE